MTRPNQGLSSLAPGDGKMRDPGNEVGTVYYACCTRWFDLYKSVDETLVCDHSNESRIEQFFHMVLFIMPDKVVLTFNSMDKTQE